MREIYAQNDPVSRQSVSRDAQSTKNEKHITHPFNGPLSRTTRVGRYQKGKTNLDFSEARDSEWQWHQLGHMQVCTSLLTDNHASNPPLSFLQAGCPSCRPTNSVKALKAGHSHRSFEANSRLVQCSVAELHASTANSNSDNDNQIVWLHCSIS